jgi:hypothetical protein
VQQLFEELTCNINLKSSNKSRRSTAMTTATATAMATGDFLSHNWNVLGFRVSVNLGDF